MQRMESASLMVSKRWATMMTVLPLMRFLRPSFTCDWDSLSRADVASSSSSMGLSFKSALAMATRWSSPPLSASFDTRVWRPRGNLTGFLNTTSSKHAPLQATWTSSSDGSISQP
mmetsp:Transcript_113298/g.331137  ORF Transcript_113298/g.331137 Transcript_113298/m.331137 type:complete len:115 (-) Transcript_113298:51-395(-)